MSEAFELLLYGVSGGLLAEFLSAYAHREKAFSAWPAKYRQITYWVMQAGMVLAGGGIVWLYLASDVSLNAVLAANIGATAPMILTKLFAKEPSIADSE